MDKKTLSHTKWECKYHIVFAPKYRRQIVYGNIREDVGRILGILCKRKGVEIPSLTVNKRQNSRKACIYRLCGCLFVCIDMCYIFAFVLVIFFAFEIIPRIATFDMNSKSVLNPNEL